MEQTIKTKEGYEIKYFTYGDKSKLPLFFITGIGGNSNVWGDFVDLFKDDFYVITNDFRGFGFSHRPQRVEDYEFENFAEDLDLVLQNENISQVTLIGHCFGGTVAINYAKRFGSKVDKLVLIETSNETSNLAKFFIKVKPLMYAFNYFLKVMPIWYKKGYQNFKKYKGAWDLEPLHIVNDMVRSSAFSYLSTLYNYLMYVDSPEFKSDKKTLLIAGKKDVVYPKAQVKKLKEIFLNNEYIEIDDNHLLPVNRPEELMHLIKNFLSK